MNEEALISRVIMQERKKGLEVECNRRKKEGQKITEREKRTRFWFSCELQCEQLEVY